MKGKRVLESAVLFKEVTFSEDVNRYMLTVVF